MLMYAPAYGTELIKARRLTEREQKDMAAWARELVCVRLGEGVKLYHPDTATVRLALSRKADGQFEGCENRAVTITPAEWDAIVAEQAAADQAEARKRQAVADQAAAKRAAALAEARATGKAVVLNQWITDQCMSHHDDECSFDSAVEWLQPDGTTKVTYSCCY